MPLSFRHSLLLLGLASTVVVAAEPPSEFVVGNTNLSPASVSEPSPSSPGEDETFDDAYFRKLVAFDKETNPTPENPADILRDADKDFVRKGLPISPAVLREFLHPAVVEVDLLCVGNNRNEAADFTVRKLSDTHTWSLLNDGSLRSTHLCRTDSGIHVVRLEQPAKDDLGIACRLLLLRVELRSAPVFAAKSPDKIIRRQADKPAVVLRLVGNINLGDRDRRIVTSEGPTLILHDPLAPERRTVVTIPKEL